MPDRLAGKVAFITGAARGQGRSHALRLAEDGAAIIAIDLCRDVDTVPYPQATQGDLAETVALVEHAGGRAVSMVADVRDQAQLSAAAQAGMRAFGRVDIVVANAGVWSSSPSLEMAEDAWSELIDINLSGVWRTCKATIPLLIQGGNGGSVVITSSSAGLKAAPNSAHYTAAKHGLIGLTRTLALEHARHSIRVNSVHPTIVDTDMVQNDTIYRLFCPDIDEPTRADFEARARNLHPLPVSWVLSRDVSHAVAFLASDEARYITGVALPIDAGYTIR